MSEAITSPPEASQNNSEVVIFSVEELNRHIRQLIEGELGLVWIQGEISNFKAHTSGHFYFSLKDAKSQISAVMFRGYNSRLKFKPTDGLEVVIRGRVSVYEPRGSYQIVCEMMEPVGAGALQKAFEQLKEKLKSEGLFDASKKRPLPSLPRHVAIVTSPTGAAIRDMINVLSRRHKGLKITVVPTIVQGESAAPQIVEALKKAYQLVDIEQVDTIIIGRGGGSIEDLWAFNDEKLARVIAESPVPIVSAVGHEIDFTIADFVADLRAPTPSAAAELVVKNASDLTAKIESLKRHLISAWEKNLKIDLQKLRSLSVRLVDPQRRLQDLSQRNDELWFRLQQTVLAYLQKKKLEIKLATETLKSPEQVLMEKTNQLETARFKLTAFSQRLIEKKRFRLERMMSQLDGLSPLKVVERGYSVTTVKNVLIKSSDQVKKGDEINIRLMKGNLSATVTDIIK
jgi:exodeoxyribonuclease VII large subunit